MTRPSLEELARRASTDLREVANERAYQRPSVDRLRRRATVRRTAVAAATVVVLALVVVNVARVLPGRGPTIGNPASTGADLQPLTTTTEALLVLSTDRVLATVDVDRREVDIYPLDELASGDPLVRLAVRGMFAVFYGGQRTFTAGLPGLELPDVYPISPADTAGAGFLPADGQDLVWLIRSPGGAEGPRVTLVDPTGEIVAAEEQLPAGAPVATVAGGLVLQRSDQLLVWDAAAGVTHTLEDGRFVPAAQDSRVAWCGEGCTQLHVLDIDTGEELSRMPAPAGTVFAGYAGAFSPDGSLLAVPLSAVEGGHGRGLALIDTAKWSQRVVAADAMAETRGHVGWSPDSRFVFFDLAPDRIGVWQVGETQARTLELDLPSRLVPFHGFDVTSRDRLDPPPQPAVVTDREDVLEVEVAGVPHTLTVWRRADDSVCAELDGQACFGSPTRGQLLSGRASTTSSAQGKPATGCEFGAVHPSVADVVLAFPDGTEQHAVIGDAPDSVGGRYYASCWEGNRAPPTLVLLDSSGQELLRHAQ